jgi:outer membrane protein OmpA-like peptidoglycan-associated protein
MINQIDSALWYYNIAKNEGLKTGTNIPELQAQLSKYDSAKYNYEQLIIDNKTKLYELRLSGFSNFNKFYEDSLDYQIFNTKFNTIYNDLNIVPYNSGYVFESNRFLNNKKQKSKKVLSPEFSWDGNPYSSLYYVSNTHNIRVDSLQSYQWKEKNLGNNVLNTETNNDSKKILKSVDYTLKKFDNDTSIKLFSKWIRTKLNVGSITFTKDAKTAYFTRNGRRYKKNYLLEIWEAKFIHEKWKATKKMFFNRKNYNYFHPSITPDGKRLYYVSDESNGFGGTDIYYTEKNEDGSWKPTINAGREINTTANELFPTFYESELYFSSNGHPGLGGLDIFKLIKDYRGDLIAKNIGYPINSSKDDLSFIMKDNSGFFSSNRKGSDDIYAFDFKPIYLSLKGQIQFENRNSATKKIYLIQTNELGWSTIIDSAYLDTLGSFDLKARPNNNYKIIVFNGNGNKLEIPVIANDYVYQNGSYLKQLNGIVFPLTDAEIVAKKETLITDSILTKQIINNDKLFAKTLDSLMKLTDDYVELHHPFNKVAIIQKDLPNYKKLLERIKLMRGREIVIVSATDCKGTEAYNEGLSERRAKNLFNSIFKLAKNKVIIKHVGERELLKACNDVKKSIEEQLVNRYSYVFIMKKK